MPEKINPQDIVPMDLFCETESFGIDLVYADINHSENIFGISLYGAKARLSLHRDMARIVILTARALQEKYGWTMILKDGLRTVDAQSRLMETDIVKAHPEWLQGPNRLLSSPGGGGHPRGMAIDVSIKGIDMGTRFDEMTPQSARDYTGFSPTILDNRKRLEEAFITSAHKLSLPMLPLPSEWWDFRFPASYYEDHLPLHEADLPSSLQMRTPSGDAAPHFDRIMKEVLNSL